MAHRELGELLGKRSPARRLAVFSHPAHELAVWGLMQRLQPYALYLTDGRWRSARP